MTATKILLCFLLSEEFAIVTNLSLPRRWLKATLNAMTLEQTFARLKLLIDNCQTNKLVLTWRLAKQINSFACADVNFPSA
jgi:hypothetical protein